MRNKKLGNYLLLSVLTAAASTFSHADMVYKSTDKDGHTTYSSTPPATPQEKAKTVEMSIDPNQNVMPATPGQRPPSTGAYQSQNGADTTDPRNGKIAEAEAALQAAEQALAAGQESQPGDFTGKKGGSVGPSAQRIDRINELQDAVERAKEALERTRGERD